MFTAPNWLDRIRMLWMRAYPDALVDGEQFSEWDSALERMGIVTRADRSPRRCLRAHMKAEWKREVDYAAGRMGGKRRTSVAGGPHDSLQVANLYTGIMQHGILVPRSIIVVSSFVHSPKIILKPCSTVQGGS